MLSNMEIKRIRSLREKKVRDALGLFVVEGDKMVAEALSSGMEVVRVVRKEDVGEAVMSRISSLSTPPPSLSVVRMPLPSGPGKPEGLCLALDSIRDPGNLGTILRLSDWFGVDSIFASPDTVEAYNPKVIQASMGAIFRKRLIYCNLPDLCRSFTAASLPVFGTFLDGHDIYSTALSKEGLIVMGNEADGISPEVEREITMRLTIPSFAAGPTAESLNVAVATAITLSEFKRR